MTIDSLDASKTVNEGLIPKDIKLLQKSKLLTLEYDDSSTYLLPCEYLRVYSPSAEVRGHGGNGGSLPVDKENVNIISIQPVGHYALKFVFDDGHQTGIYTWEYLYELAVNYDIKWQQYLERLEAID